MGGQGDTFCYLEIFSLATGEINFVVLSFSPEFECAELSLAFITLFYSLIIN
jgi:hypothetical protein